MKRTLVVSAIVLLALGANAQAKKTTKPVAKAPVKTTAAVKPLKTLNDSLSYAFGVSLGEYLKSQGVTTVNYTMLNKALDQCIKGQQTYMDVNVANYVMSRAGEAKRNKIAAVEKEKGRKFLEENKKKPGVTVTPSGLQYEVLVKGTGERLSRTDTFSAHYRGMLLDGKEFDNSYSRGKPLAFPVGAVIPGWTEALTLMPIGSKWKLYIPSEIGYGENGAGADIPGGATLVFEVELLGKGSMADMQAQSQQQGQQQ